MEVAGTCPNVRFGTKCAEMWTSVTGPGPSPRPPRRRASGQCRGGAQLPWRVTVRFSAVRAATRNASRRSRGGR